MARVLFIDNFDSFTYNLVDEFETLGHAVTVTRNNVALSELIRLSDIHDLILLSPGPGNPQSAGNCLTLLDHLMGKKPIMGICLGHQLLVEHQGGRVVKAPLPVHGKFAQVEHNNNKCFSGLNNPLSVGRYHSLVVEKVPENFQVLASVNDLVMSVYDEKNKLLGFQFHPESILTLQGKKLIQQSIDLLLNNNTEYQVEALV
ncbi:aminodeoxychorismate/anthranilate synthase component II [Pleionea sediminis]|uniref:aminodeoxychorismate/anthranilate synthase component II n=1 Tax=Pleionea sediminis TaxID=2569479 RepID=UPI0011870789|nr:aminodeoxychorismate/anthranilate synthase component II [Pleionea sediminis]